MASFSLVCVWGANVDIYHFPLVKRVGTSGGWLKDSCFFSHMGRGDVS